MPDEQSPGSKYQKGVLYDIPVSDLKTDPNQPRKYLDPQALEDLTTSIAQHGVLTPILFRVAPAAPAPAPASAGCSTPGPGRRRRPHPLHRRRRTPLRGRPRRRPHHHPRSPRGG